MTRNETWEQCLKMWRWIVRQPCPRNVYDLKREWTRKNGFGDDMIAACFFCEYNAQRNGDGNCSQCPGRKVDKNFCCENYDYDYSVKPAAFLRKITKLNKIRLAKKARRILK